jgi:hypothetical protein
MKTVAEHNPGIQNNSDSLFAGFFTLPGRNNKELINREGLKTSPLPLFIGKMMSLDQLKLRAVTQQSVHLFVCRLSKKQKGTVILHPVPYKRCSKVFFFLFRYGTVEEIDIKVRVWSII